LIHFFKRVAIERDFRRWGVTVTRRMHFTGFFDC